MLVEHLLSSSAQAPPLRVAVLLDDGLVSGPDAQLLDHLLRVGFAEIVLVVHEARRPQRRSLPGRLVSAVVGAGGSHLLFDAYERWDRRRVGAPIVPLASTDAGRRLASVPSLRVESAGVNGDARLPDGTLERIREWRIDVALRLGCGGAAWEGSLFARPAAAGIAVHGVWECRLGDGERYRGGPPSFWELAEGNPLSGVSLEVTRPEGRLVLCKGVAATASEHGDFSLARNRVRPHLLGTTLVLRKLKQLHEHGFAALERDAVPPGPYRGRRDVYRTPSNVEMAAFLVPRIARKARARLLDEPRVVQWRVGVRVGGTSRIETGRPLGVDGFRWIEAPPGRLYADPMLVERAGLVWCFFEDLDHARRIGRISCAAVDGEGRFVDVRPALELPYHLSYPFVFEHAGDWFMVPESRRNGTVDLFRAVEFPGRWEKVRTLLHGPGLDTTVLRKDGSWWFFVAVREPEGAGEQLLLYRADSLDGELTLHPGSPISTDIRSCRPAGAIFEQDGRLVRPSQDGSVTYGHQLGFHEILRLDPDEYREQAIATVPPPRGMEGIHTYARAGRVEVVDGKRLEPASRHLARRTG
jgi:hypothetical protein